MSGAANRVAAVRATLAVSLVVSVCSLVLGALSLSGGVPADASSGASHTPTGTLTVAEVGSEWPGLDPATGTEVSADYDYMNAVFGQLFVPGPNFTILPDLATGYHFSKDGLTLTVPIRQGVTFQDGTPFTAQAVQYNLQRDLDPKNGCACLADFSAVKSVTTSGNDVVLSLSTPDYPLVDAWIDNEAPNWIASPAALAKEGVSGFDIHPVGAGPFEVQTNVVNSKLVLKAYPGYWQKGYPKLQTLTFLSVGSAASAYSALQAGSIQVVANGLSVQLLDQAKRNSSLKVMTLPGPRNAVVQLNTTIPPFNNKVAREALYYATDAPAYLRAIGGGQGVLSQSPSGPGGQFFEKTVPGYRTYNLKKARSLVKELGGLSFTYQITNTPDAVTAGTALQAMWQRAGMHVTLQPLSFPQIVLTYVHHSWQASAEVVGSFEPSIGTSGLAIRFSSKGALSGVKNPTLDNLIARAVQTSTLQKRKAIYDQVFKIISDEAYGPLLYVASGNVVMAKAVTGVHPVFMASFGPMIEWQDVGLS
jgi:peptide/nickel transport system substrate-binding protein